MMDTRISSTLTGDGRALADGIVARLVEIGGACHGTAIIGSGDPMILNGLEVAPRIVVPLAWHQRPNPIGRDQVAHADAVVLVHEDEIDLITDGIGGAPLLIIAARGAAADGSFLRTTNPYEAVGATRAVARHPALNDALPGIPVPAVAWRDLVNLAAEAIVEAFVAAGGGQPASPPDPSGRR